MLQGGGFRFAGMVFLVKYGVLRLGSVRVFDLRFSPVLGPTTERKADNEGHLNRGALFCYSSRVWV